MNTAHINKYIEAERNSLLNHNLYAKINRIEFIPK